MLANSRDNPDNIVCDFVQDAYKDVKILSIEEQIKLIKKYRQSRGKNRREYKEKLVATLWRYAVKEADKFKHVIDSSTARQAAYTGLITTLDKYRINSGSALTTCMFWRVKLELIRTIYKVKYQIHLPEYLYTKIRKLIEDKCSYEDITRMTSSDLATLIFGDNPSHAQVRKMEVFMQTGIPLDLDIGEHITKENIPVYEENGYRLAEIRADVNKTIIKALRTPKVDSETQKPIFSSHKFPCKCRREGLKLKKGDDGSVKIPYNVIDLRDYDIVCMYYGLNGRFKYGLKEIGEEYNITRERVRQIRDRVHDILRVLLIDYK